MLIGSINQRCPGESWLVSGRTTSPLIQLRIERSNNLAVQKLVCQMISTNFTLAGCTVCSTQEVGFIRPTKEISMLTCTALLTGSWWRY